MADGIGIEFVNGPEVGAAFDDLTVRVKAASADFLARQALAVEAAAKAALMAAGKRDTGKLLQSIQAVAIDETTWQVGTNNPYAIFVHGDPAAPADRTRPHFPPIAAITPWATRHGIPPFVVARAIAAKGTSMVPFMTTALTVVAPEIAVAWAGSIAKAVA